jgi:tetratricopeptide (TPR) repeat protein
VGAPSAAEAGETVARTEGGPERAEPSGARRWLFRAVLVLVPFLALLLLELLLRAIGYGVPMGLTLRQEVAGEPRRLSNPHFTWLFFDPAVARLMPPFSLSPSKPAATCRIFVLGSSAAQGDPEPSFGLARMLDALLREQYPGVDFDVVNMAATAVNSHAVYAVAREAARLEPDLFVVYAGNNEVVGPYGAGTVLTSAAPDVRLVRASLEARRTRLGQLAGAAAGAVARRLGRARSPGAWHGMEMFLERQVRRSDPALERSYRSYEANLADTIAVASRAGAPVVLSTVAVNLRSGGPFASRNGPGLSAADLARWRELYAEGVRLQAEGHCALSLAPLEEAFRLDPEHADTAYRLGRCEIAASRDAARAHLAAARDLDTLRFRADSRTNAIVREVAGRAGAGVRLVDAEARLAAADPLGAPGGGLFLDHVHLTFHGNYVLASAVVDGLRPLLPARVRERAARRPLLDEGAAARALAYTDLDRYRIAETMRQRLRDAPFTERSDHAEQVRRFEDEMAQLRAGGEAGAVDSALARYAEALARPGAHWSVRERHAAILHRLGRFDAAAREWRVLTALFPPYPAFHLQLARSLRDGGRLDEAQAALRPVLEFQADAPPIRVEAARLALARGRRGNALAHARRAVAGDPRDANALSVLAAALCPRRQCTPDERAEAVSLLDRALAVAPESETARRERDALAAGSGP